MLQILSTNWPHLFGVNPLGSISHTRFENIHLLKTGLANLILNLASLFGSSSTLETAIDREDDSLGARPYAEFIENI